MTTYRTREDKAAPSAAEPYCFQTAAVTAALDRLRRRYPGDLPPLDEVRADLDKALGKRSVKELVDEVRGKL